MDEPVTPDWLITPGGLELRSVDYDEKLLVLANNQGQCEPEFGRIPAGWSIQIVAGSFGARTTVSSSGQEREVTWHLEPGQQSSWELPGNVTGVTINPRSVGQTVHVTYRRNNAKLRLGAGDYEIDTGAGQGGTYTAETLADSPRDSRLSLGGPGRVRRISGRGEVRLTVNRPDTDFDLSGAATHAEIIGDCARLRIVIAGTVDLRGAVADELSVTAKAIKAGWLTASGELVAEDIALDGDIAPKARLVMTYSRTFVVTGAVTCCDLRPNQLTEDLPLAIIGGQDTGSGLGLDPEPPVERDLAAPVPPPSALMNFRRDRPQDLTDSTVVGPGILVVTGSVRSSHIAGIDRCAVGESITLGHVTSHPPTISCDLLAIGGKLDLNGGEARIGRFLQASEIADGSVASTDANKLLVTGASFTNVQVRASGIGVHPTDRTHIAVVHSSLHAFHNLNLQGLPDDQSEIELEGNGDVNAELLNGTAFTWTPGEPWRPGDPRTLKVHARVSHLRVVALGPPELSGVVKLVGSVEVKELSISGSVTVFAETTPAKRELPKVNLSDKSSVTIGGTLHSIGALAYGSECHFSYNPESRDSALNVSLAPAGADADLTLVAVQGKVHLEPRAADLTDSLPTDSRPNVTAISGSFGIGDWLTRLHSLGTESAPVKLDVTSTGRIDSLAGAFWLLGMRGRIEGSAKANESAAMLVRWINAEEPSASRARAGELANIDVSRMPASEVSNLAMLHVLSPSAEPLIEYAKALGPSYVKQLRAMRQPGFKGLSFTSDDNIRAEAQKLKEIADIVRSRANSSAAFTAAQWSASHAHALQVRPGGERALRWFHRLVGYGVRPLPALAMYGAWTALVTTVLAIWDDDGPRPQDGSGFRCGPYTWLDSLWRALLLPASLLRSDFGGAKPYSPAFHHPAAHYALVLGTGIIVGFLVLAIRNFLVRPKSDT